MQADTIVPEPGNPQALNRFSYVYSNALRYTDSTGHIKNDAAEVRRAQEILDLLAQYGVSITCDWGWRRADDISSPYWEEGSWELGELEYVLVGVERLGGELGGARAFRESIGWAHFRRVRGRDLLWLACTYIVPRVRPAALTLGRVITLYDSTFTDYANPAEVAVHELAHVWAIGTWASGSIGDFVGTELRPSRYAYQNPEEHWAEAVAHVLCPSHHAPVGPLHRQYVALAVEGRIPEPFWYTDLMRCYESLEYIGL